MQGKYEAKYTISSAMRKKTVAVSTPDVCLCGFGLLLLPGNPDLKRFPGKAGHQVVLSE